MHGNTKTPALACRGFCAQNWIIYNDPFEIGLTQIPSPAIAVLVFLFVCLCEPVRNATK